MTGTLRRHLRRLFTYLTGTGEDERYVSLIERMNATAAQRRTEDDDLIRRAQAVADLVKIKRIQDSGEELYPDLRGIYGDSRAHHHC